MRGCLPTGCRPPWIKLKSETWTSLLGGGRRELAASSPAAVRLDTADKTSFPIRHLNNEPTKNCLTLQSYRADVKCTTLYPNKRSSSYWTREKENTGRIDPDRREIKIAGLITQLTRCRDLSISLLLTLNFWRRRRADKRRYLVQCQTYCFSRMSFPLFQCGDRGTNSTSDAGGRAGGRGGQPAR
jgi:hypothetical protein